MMVHIMLLLSMYLLMAVIKVQPTDGSCTGNSNCKCSVGYFGPNCSLACRHPGYGQDCQLECNCSAEYCDVIFGCLNHTTGAERKFHEFANASTNQDKGTFNESSEEIGGLEKDPTAFTIPIVISIVFIICVVFAIVLAKYFKRKHLVKKHSMGGKGEKTKTKHVEELLNRRPLCADVTNENLYEDMDKSKTDISKEVKANDVVENDSFEEKTYVDSFAFKREKISQNRDSQHFYAPLEKESE